MLDNVNDLKLFVAGFNTTNRLMWDKSCVGFDRSISLYSLNELLEMKEVVKIIEEHTSLEKFISMTLKDKIEFLKKKSLTNLKTITNGFKTNSESEIKKTFIIYGFQTVYSANFSLDLWKYTIMKNEKIYGINI